MRFSPSLFIAAAMLSASVANATPLSDRPLPVDREPTLADRLFPETDIEGEGWRGLLPVMLMNHDAEALRLIAPRKREAATSQ